MLEKLFGKRQRAAAVTDHRVYVSLSELIKLEYLARGFSFLPGQPVNSLLTGRHHSKLRGRGLNFEELRHYRPGDDIRTMDWKVTNRTRRPHVRVFTEERERNVILLIDQRVGMFFGSKNRMKSVAAAQAAALIAWRVLAAGDRVGAVIINDEAAVTIRPQRSRSNVIRILSTLAEANQKLTVGRKSHPEKLLDALGSVAKNLTHDALLISVGDGAGWTRAATERVRLISRHNDIVAIKVFDPAEETLPEIDHLVVSDGLHQVEIVGQRNALGQRFNQHYEQDLGLMKSEFKKFGIPLIPVDTIQPMHAQLIHALGGIGR